MKNRQEKIYSILKELALEMGAKDFTFAVEVPKDKSHGDLASNIALAIFSDIKNKKLHPSIIRPSSNRCSFSKNDGF